MTRQCQNCKTDFDITDEDLGFYSKIDVPPPTWCWLCRVQRRLAFRNERCLYKCKSAFSGVDIFSAYAPNPTVKVYENDVWYGDGWDALQYGKEIDWSRPMMEQIQELVHEVPLQARSVELAVNSDYVNNATGAKNCYLIFNSTYVEDSFYGNGVDYSKECVDCSHVIKSESCYGSFWLIKCAKVFYSSQCEECNDVYFSKNLKGCTNCFGCVNLRNKSYYIFNQPYTKDEYLGELKKYDLSSHIVRETVRQKSKEFWQVYPVKYIDGIHNADVSGNYIYNSKNVHYGYLAREAEDIKYCQYIQVPTVKDSYDYSIWGNNVSRVYESEQIGNGANNIKFCGSCWKDVRDMEYSMFCQVSAYLFGCVGLYKKQYCILNKQYSKEEYEDLVPRIIVQMKELPYKDKKGRIYPYGEFFPIELSLFGYNESVAQDQFPLTKEEAIEKGYLWRDSEERQLKIDIEAIVLPDNIHEVTDDILNKIIGCEHKGTCNDQCTMGFRLIPQELEFYRKFNIPVPRLCFHCRTNERLTQRAHLELYERGCMCEKEGHHHEKSHCPNTFQTSYAPDRSEIVYCEACYNSEVV
jgi:hypothetical protein